MAKVSRVCQTCEKVFHVQPSVFKRPRTALYCSSKCRVKGRSYKLPRIADLVCTWCGIEFRRRHNRVSKGDPYCSRKCLGASNAKRLAGEQSFNWRGGVSNRTSRSRTVIEELKRAVGRCQRCGAVGKLQGHHKKEWSTHPDLRECADNIEILCDACHALEHPQLAAMIDRSRPRSGRMIDCQTCSKSFYVKPHLVAKVKYCSKYCYYQKLRAA